MHLWLDWQSFSISVSLRSRNKAKDCGKVCWLEHNFGNWNSDNKSSTILKNILIKIISIMIWLFLHKLYINWTIIININRHAWYGADFLWYKSYTHVFGLLLKLALTSGLFTLQDFTVNQKSCYKHHLPIIISWSFYGWRDFSKCLKTSFFQIQYSIFDRNFRSTLEVIGNELW